MFEEKKPSLVDGNTEPEIENFEHNNGMPPPPAMARGGRRGSDKRGTQRLNAQAFANAVPTLGMDDAAEQKPIYNSGVSRDAMSEEKKPSLVDETPEPEIAHFEQNGGMPPSAAAMAPPRRGSDKRGTQRLRAQAFANAVPTLGMDDAPKQKPMHDQDALIHPTMMQHRLRAEARKQQPLRRSNQDQSQPSHAAVMQHRVRTEARKQQNLRRSTGSEENQQEKRPDHAAIVQHRLRVEARKQGTHVAQPQDYEQDVRPSHAVVMQHRVRTEARKKRSSHTSSQLDAGAIASRVSDENPAQDRSGSPANAPPYRVHAVTMQHRVREEARKRRSQHARHEHPNQQQTEKEKSQKLEIDNTPVQPLTPPGMLEQYLGGSRRRGSGTRAEPGANAQRNTTDAPLALSYSSIRPGYQDDRSTLVTADVEEGSLAFSSAQVTGSASVVPVQSTPSRLRTNNTPPPQNHGNGAIVSSTSQQPEIRRGDDNIFPQPGGEKQKDRKLWWIVALAVLLAFAFGLGVGLGLGLTGRSGSAPGPPTPPPPEPSLSPSMAPSPAPTITMTAPPTLSSWIAVSDMTFDSAASDQLGASVAMDDNILAVSSPGYNNSIGLVRVIYMDTQEQIGLNLTGDIQGEKFGMSLALSVSRETYWLSVLSSGGVTGVIRVYRYDSGGNMIWEQVGNNIDETVLLNTTLPLSTIADFAMSGDGSTVAVAMNRGVAVLGLNTASNEWELRGNIFSLITDSFVSLSDDGDEVLVAPKLFGAVQLYYFSAVANSWISYFPPLADQRDIAFPFEQSSAGAVIAKGGTRLALADERGIVQVYSINNFLRSWEVRGLPIPVVSQPQVPGLIMDISLSEDGSAIAIAYILPDIGVRVRVFEDTGEISWFARGQEIRLDQVYPGGTEDITAVSVSMANDGMRFALGLPFADSNGLDSGSLEFYEF